jgi:hypothetical protein
VPARDEASRIAACIGALRRAADATPATVAVTIACDRCEDGTAEAAAHAIEGDHRFTVISGAWVSAGGARRAAARHALLAIEAELADTWVLSTDADTVVPADWIRTILDAAHNGVEAVAGIVELARDDDWSPAIDAAFSLGYDLGSGAHRHVHAANLAVRADAYERVGGFPATACGEDHALWRALLDAGHRCVPSLAWRVATSARLSARATGGFADTIAARLASTTLAAGA